MLHPILAAIEPPILIGRGVETRVLVHSRVDEVLNIWGITSVNFPLMPFSVLGWTE